MASCASPNAGSANGSPGPAPPRPPIGEAPGRAGPGRPGRRTARAPGLPSALLIPAGAFARGAGREPKLLRRRHHLADPLTYLGLGQGAEEPVQHLAADHRHDHRDALHLQRRASCGLASTSTLASTQAPSASAASFSSTGDSCLHGPHHSAHRSRITGTSRDRSTTSALKVSSVTSMT